MLNIQRNVDIRSLLSMKIGGVVDYYCSITDCQHIPQYVEWARSNSLELLVLGGGSNLVMCDQGFSGLVLRIENKGIHILKQDSGRVEVEVAAGEVWDDFVRFTVENGYWGCENLSLIPGSVGATPVQNVGAFGQEVKDTIVYVNAYDLVENSFVRIQNAECEFSFRESIFNTKYKDRYIVISVVFRLSAVPSPKLHRNELRSFRDCPVDQDGLQQSIRNTVIAYRSNGKNLPAGHDVGSSGTFFKTAIVDSYWALSKIFFRTLFKLGPLAAASVFLFSFKYRSGGSLRVPSKLLIKFCNLSDSVVGSVSLLPTNPAVVISDLKGSPSSVDLQSLIKTVKSVVKNKTGVELPVEPVLVGFDK